MTCRILVALDGSPAAEAPLSEVERLVVGGAGVHFLHVVPLLPLSMDATSVGVMSGHDQALSYLGSVRERLPDVRGLDLIRTGDPAGAILQVATEFDIDLIALGTPAQPDGATRSLGSVADTVVRGAQGPVLLSRLGSFPARKVLRRILVPLDGSEESFTILQAVTPIALRTGAEVVFLHVSERALPPPARPRSPAEIKASENPEERLLNLADRLEKSDLEFWQTVAQGDAVEEIVAHADTLDADLIAMSTQVGTGMETTIVGSAAATIMALSDRAVLVQRPGAQTVARKAWQFQ